MSDFSDKVVCITGAAGNLGSATALAFGQADARLALIDRQREALILSFSDTIPEGADSYYVAGDLTDEQSVQEMVDGIMNHYGRVDVLINVAGGFSKGPPLHETPLSTWEFMLNLNAKTVFLMSRAVVPIFIAQEYGKMVNISARAALHGAANMGPYVASKSAVIRLTESLSAEMRDYVGINVNCILPGTIDTPRNREDTPQADFSKWVSPEAMAEVILFLASDNARAINGAAIPVYGRSGSS